MCRTTISLLFLSLFVLFASTLKFNYPELDIQENSTSVGWTFDAGRNCGTVFKLQGFTLSSISSSLIVPRITSAFNHSRNIRITSNQLRTRSGTPIVYRLVAVDNDGTICSSDQTTFYRFDVPEKTETRTLSPNSTTCYDIPVTDICVTSLSFVWPQSVDSDSCSSCSCPIHNSTNGRTTFEECACLRDADVTPHFSENGSICVSDLNSRLNGVVVNFVCTTDSCIGECFLKTIISSYRIVIPDVHEMESTTRTSHTDIDATSTSTPQTAQSTVEMTLGTVMTDEGPDTKIAVAVGCCAGVVAVVFIIVIIIVVCSKYNCCGCCDDRKKSTNHHQQETDPPPPHPQALSNASQLPETTASSHKTVFPQSKPCRCDMERSLVIGLQSASAQLSDADILDRFAEEVGRRGRGLQRALSEEEGAQEMKTIAESVKHFNSHPCVCETTFTFVTVRLQAFTFVRLQVFELFLPLTL